jgi:hypothetical protein
MALPKLDVPRYETKLPSTGEKVIYRPYLVKEERILMLALESNEQTQMVRAIKDVISSCTDGVINVDKITMFDLEFMFMKLRSKSVGETTEVSVPCTECETRNPIVVDLEKLTIDVPKDKLAKRIKLTDTVGVMMRYPTVNELIQIEADEDTQINTIFKLITICIESIYSGDELFDTKDQSEQELKEFIESLNSDQFNEIKKFVENMPTAKIHAVFDCSQCKTHNDVEVKGLGNFFG